MQNEIADNNKRFLERIEFYRSLGLDQIGEREFVLEVSLPAEEKILEIGTGKGNFAIGLASRGYKFVSIDPDLEGQKIAQLNLAYYDLQDSVDLQIQNAEKLSFENNSFNSIFCINAYHHFEKPALILAEMLRVLSDEGRIILSDFNAHGFGILERAHELEGGNHECFNQNMNFAQDFFIDKGFGVKKTSNLNQQTLVFSRSI